MSGYTKLFGSILDSTIWREDDKTRLLWITMLATAGKGGFVEASIPGLADRARISIADCEAGLAKLLAPDPYSRTKDFEGRRIEVIDGGWKILNYPKYREKLSKEDRQRYMREYMQDYRVNKNVNTEFTEVNSKQKLTQLTHSSASSDSEATKVQIKGGAGIPATEQEAVEWAAMENVPADFAAELFTQKEATVWENGNHAPITNWRKYVKSRWSKAQKAKVTSPTTPEKALSILDLKTIIAAKQTRANQIKNQYCSEVAMGDSWSDMAKKREWRQLCAEIWKLNDKIAHSA